MYQSAPIIALLSLRPPIVCLPLTSNDWT